MNKTLQLVSLMCVGLAGSTALAAPTKYEIPANQAEFESQWEIVNGTADATWEWVEAAVPYAQTPPVNTSQSGSEIGPTLVLNQPFEMKAGDIYYLQANICSANYNDDERFYIVVGTDKNDMKPFKTSSSSFYIYRGSGLADPNFQIKPTDTSNDRKFEVPADGTYYIGVRSWYGSGSFSPKALQLQALVVDKEVDYPQKVQSASAKADATGALEVTLSWTWPTKTLGNKTITEPIGANIYRSTSNAKADLYTAESLIATVNEGVAGEKATYIDSEITEPGKYYYYIAPFNSNGENGECTSVNITEMKWVGEDVKALNPLNAVAKADGDNVVLTFKNRYEGYNGGYIDPAKLTNQITRSKNGGEAVVIAESYSAEAGEDGLTTYVDTELDGLGTYEYKVYALYNETLSVAVTAPKIVAGGAYDVPYNQDFSESTSFEGFSTEQSSTYNTWARYASTGSVRFSPGYSTYTDYTATLFTPPIHLEAGKTYKVSILAWGDAQSSGGSYWDDEDEEENETGYPMTFYAATAPATSGAVSLSDQTITGLSGSKQSMEAFFAPETSGSYYFGFKTSSSGNKCVYLDDIAIDLSEIRPATVSDLSMVASETGANEATISFTVPSTTNAGLALENVDGVKVTRYNEEGEATVVKNYDTVTPGEELSLADQVPEAGLYAYGVVVELGETESAEARCEAAWIGHDVPKQLSAFSMGVDLDEDATPVVRWQALTGTVMTMHGGYYDAANVRYRVYRKDNVSRDAEAELVGETDQLTYADASIHEAEWSQYSYGVSVVNGDQEGRMSETYSKVHGGVVDLPYEPDLTNDAYVSALEGRGFTADNGIAWKNGGENMRDDNYAFLPPFMSKLSSTPGAKIKFNVSRSSASYEELLEVYLCTVKVDASSLRNEASNSTEAAVIPGADNMKLVQTVPVHALADEPESVEIAMPFGAAGKYRMAIRCASAYNRGVTVHSVAIEHDTTVGVEEISINEIEGDADYYTLQGVKVAHPSAGLYIRVVNGRASKVMICE